MPQSEHESSINWNRYAKIAIHISTRLSKAHIEESSVYALLVLTELSILSIDKQEQLLFTTLDIGAVFINVDVIFIPVDRCRCLTKQLLSDGITAGQ